MIARAVNVEALRAAARAAIVMPAVFAFASNVIARPQTSLFAAFGSFAVLVLVDFGGRRRIRLVAYLAFAVAGAGLISLGTICSRDPWLAAGAMAAVGFAILFAGAFSGYLAAAANGAILLFVLPANVPAPDSAIPDRLLGWCLAAGAGTVAALVLWPSRRRADLRRAAAGAIRRVLDLIEADPAEQATRAEAARAGVAGLSRRFLGSQHRPAGPTAATAALVALPDELDWLLSFLPATREDQTVDGMARENAETMAAAAAVLDASADRLEGGDAQADFERLDRARADHVRALIRTLPELMPDDDPTALTDVLETPFRVSSSSFAARELAVYAMRATDGDEPEPNGAAGPSRADKLDAAERLAIEHASVRSVWLQNSVRGAVALALAVFVAQRSGLEHAFWVVLGTLSVLRSNALGTGRSIVTALAGTAAGIVVGAAIVIGIGTHHAALWAVLPAAVFLAAYAPRAISFAAGQAAFTIVLFVLFNLIQPVGWSVGVVRLEDVAIGFAVSLGVGLLFWPRGAATALRSDLAEAYARGADYVVAAMHDMIGGGDAEETRRAAAAVGGAAHRLDDSFRQYLVERSATRYGVEDVAGLVSAATRVRRAAESLTALAAMCNGVTTLQSCGAHLESELNAFHAWYASLAYGLVNRRPIGAPHSRDGDGRMALVECARAALRDPATKNTALSLLWAVEHLENLRRLETHIAARAQATVADAREGSRLLRLGFALTR